MALSGMEIGFLVGLLVFAAILAVGTWLLGNGSSGLAIALIVIGALGVLAFALTLIFVNNNDGIYIDTAAAA